MIFFFFTVYFIDIDPKEFPKSFQKSAKNRKKSLFFKSETTSGFEGKAKAQTRIIAEFEPLLSSGIFR